MTLQNSKEGEPWTYLQNCSLHHKNHTANIPGESKYISIMEVQIIGMQY